MMFTHTILYASSSPDLVEKRGSITKAEAINLFENFPFERELAKRRDNEDLTVPTLTFTDEADGSEFAVWSPDPGQFLIWVPAIFGLVDDITDPEHVVECLTLFFDGEIDELDDRISELREIDDSLEDL